MDEIVVAAFLILHDLHLELEAADLGENGLRHAANLDVKATVRITIDRHGSRSLVKGQPARSFQPYLRQHQAIDLLRQRLDVDFSLSRLAVWRLPRLKLIHLEERIGRIKGFSHVIAPRRDRARSGCHKSGTASQSDSTPSR